MSKAADKTRSATVYMVALGGAWGQVKLTGLSFDEMRVCDATFSGPRLAVDTLDEAGARNGLAFAMRAKAATRAFKTIAEGRS